MEKKPRFDAQLFINRKTGKRLGQDEE